MDIRESAKSRRYPCYCVDTCHLVSHEFKGLLEMVKAVNPPGGWKVLVIDTITTGIISSACGMYDIMEEGVSSKFLGGKERA